MKQKNSDVTYLSAKKSKIFYLNALEAIFIIILTLLSYFSCAQFVLKEVGQDDLIVSQNENREKIVTILEESNLAVYSEETGTLSDVDGIYKVYIYRLIKTAYTNYPEIYKEDLEEYGYLEQKEFLDGAEIISYENDYLGYFYSSYIIDKVDENNELIVNYSKSEAYFYFLNEVIDIEGRGKEFFEYDQNNLEIYPRLKKDVCRYLFQYHLMDVTYSTLIETNNNFYSYFKDLYNEAGNLLLKVPDYKNALDLYNETYDEIETNYLVSLVICYGVSIIIFYVIIPLFFKNKLTFAGKILKITRLFEDKEEKISLYFLNILCGLISNIFTLLISGLVIGGLNVLNFHFAEVGVFTFNILHIILLSFIINTISLLTFAVRKDAKGLFSLISRTSLYEIVKVDEKEEEKEVKEKFDNIFD